MTECDLTPIRTSGWKGLDSRVPGVQWCTSGLAA